MAGWVGFGVLNAEAAPNAIHRVWEPNFALRAPFSIAVNRDWEPDPPYAFLLAIRARARRGPGPQRVRNTLKTEESISLFALDRMPKAP